MKKVTCLGMANVDIIASPVDGLNPNGDTTYAREIRMVTGGDVFNTAVQLKKLGTPIAFAGTLGVDAAGAFLLQNMEGMDTAGVLQVSSHQTAVCMALVDSHGQRHFIYNPGANRLTDRKNMEKVKLQKGDFLHVGGIMQMPALEADLPAIFADAHAAGALTSMDITWDSEGKWYEKIKDALELTDYFLPSIAEARLICGCETPEQVRDFFKDFGMKALVVKLGEKGCYVTDFDRELYLDTYPTTVVDTTGAGDAFCAGFLAAVADGESPFLAAAIGNVTAAACVSTLGAAGGDVNYADVKEKAKEFYHL